MLLALLALFSLSAGALAEGEASEFQGIRSLRVVVELNMTEAQKAKYPSMQGFLEKLLFAELRGKLPATIKVQMPDSPDRPVDGGIQLDILADDWGDDSYYGGVMLQVVRKASFTGDTKNQAVVRVWEKRQIFVGPTSSDMQDFIRGIVQDLALDLVTAFYEGRPDLK